MNAPLVIEFNTRNLEMTKERLENWKNWAKDRKQYRVTPSLEGKYRPPPSWHPPEPKIFVDINDALKVERAIVGMPQPFKQVIIYGYITPFIDLHFFCRKAHIRIGEYDSYTRRALDMVHNRLMRLESFKEGLK